MPISEEQRKILLERLEKARQAKELKKQETKQAAAAPKKRAPPKPKAAPVPVQEEEQVTLEVKDTLTSSVAAPTETKPLEVIPVVVPYDAEHLQEQEIQEKREKPIKEKKIFKMDEDLEDDHKSQKQKQQKKAYAKVVFYEKPSKAESKRLMKSIHDEESSEEEEEEDEEAMVKELLNRYGHRIIPAHAPIPTQLRGHPQFRTHTDPAALASRNQYLSQLAKQCFY